MVIYTILQENYLADIKILFISALDAAQEMISILPSVKLDDIIKKPVEKEQFLYKVKMTLATSS